MASAHPQRPIGADRATARDAFTRWVCSVGQAAAGEDGLGRAAQVWCSLAVIVIGGYGLGGPLAVIALVSLIVVLLALSVASTSTPRRAIVRGALLLVAVVCAAYVWWVAGVVLDADDAGVGPPASARFGGVALVVGAVAGIGVLVTTLLSVRRTPSDQGAVEPPV